MSVGQCIHEGRVGGDGDRDRFVGPKTAGGRFAAGQEVGWAVVDNLDCLAEDTWNVS